MYGLFHILQIYFYISHFFLVAKYYLIFSFLLCYISLYYVPIILQILPPPHYLFLSPYIQFCFLFHVSSSFSLVFSILRFLSLGGTLNSFCACCSSHFAIMLFIIVCFFFSYFSYVSCQFCLYSCPCLIIFLPKIFCALFPLFMLAIASSASLSHHPFSLAFPSLIL